MRKLPLSAVNVAYVADELAKESGSRESVSLADVRALVDGEADEVARHFAAWMLGTGPAVAQPAAPELIGGFKEVFGELERLIGVAGRANGRGIKVERNATSEELDVVVKAALHPRKDAKAKSFLEDVWEVAEAEKAQRSPRSRATKPAGLKRRRVPRAPDVPKPERLARIEARIAAARAASGAKPVTTLRRVRNSDWKGAYNEHVARLAAVVLRNTGYPLMPTAICTAIAAAGGPNLRKPGRDLPPCLEGSAMVPVGVRGQIWFKGERVPDVPKLSERRDTPSAHARDLAKDVFRKVLEAMGPRGRRGISVKELTERFREELACFNRDWLKQKLFRAADDPDSPVIKVKGGYALIEKRSKRQKKAATNR